MSFNGWNGNAESSFVISASAPDLASEIDGRYV
jgi:hypothetical protein